MFLMCLLMSSCEDGRLIEPNFQQILTFTTGKNIYYWEGSSVYKWLYIDGEIQNNSNKSYITHVIFFPEDKIYFYQGLDGTIEKYDSLGYTYDKWYEREDLINIARDWPPPGKIEPFKKYSVHVSLFIDTIRYRMEIGKYRLRIDFHDARDTENAVTYHAYSNTFKIQY